MGDDRPFVCPAPGCGQRFTNEDHLAVHKHKHEMTLKFGPGRDGVIVADQTPTPTSFLKNCEEVGLFTELASPFEHDFKKVDDDDGKKSPLDLNLPSIPEVKIKVEDRMSQRSCHPNKSGSHPLTSDGDGKDQTSKRLGNTTPTIVRPGSLLLTYESAPSLHHTLPSPTSVITPTPPSNRALMSPSGSLPTVISIARPAPIIPNVPGIPGPTSNTRDPQSPTSPPIHSETRMRLKSALALQSHSVMNGNIMGSVMTIQQREMSGPLPVALSPPQPQTSPSQPMSSGAGGRRRRGTEEDPDERRQRFLERNRAAASRCRQKRKVWVSSLEKKAEELGHMNVQLQNEVRLLRSEVAQLKQLLLAHRDCPVTTIQKRTQDFIDDSPQEMSDPSSDPVGVIQRPSGGGRSTAETLASSALAQMGAAPPHPHIRSPHSHSADR